MMNVINIIDFRRKLNELAVEIDVLCGLLDPDNTIIADIPAPEKKVRKKRVRKEKPITLGAEQPSIQPHKPRRGRKGHKTKDTFYGKEEKFDTPVEQS